MEDSYVLLLLHSCLPSPSELPARANVQQRVGYMSLYFAQFVHYLCPPWGHEIWNEWNTPENKVLVLFTIASPGCYTESWNIRVLMNIRLIKESVILLLQTSVRLESFSLHHEGAYSTRSFQGQSHQQEWKGGGNNLHTHQLTKGQAGVVRLCDGIIVLLWKGSTDSAPTWMNLENIMLNKGSQTQKTTCCMHPFI